SVLEKRLRPINSPLADCRQNAMAIEVRLSHGAGLDVDRAKAPRRGCVEGRQRNEKQSAGWYRWSLKNDRQAALRRFFPTRNCLNRPMPLALTNPGQSPGHQTTPV